MSKLKMMVSVSAVDEPIITTEKYHSGFSAALTVRGVEVIITAKTKVDLAFAAKELMCSRGFGLDYGLVKKTATFGVVV